MLVMLVSAWPVLLRPPCMQVICLSLAEAPLLPNISTASSFVCRAKMPAQAGYPRNNAQEGLWGQQRTLDPLIVLEVELALLLLVALQVLVGSPGALRCCLVPGPLSCHLCVPSPEACDLIADCAVVELNRLVQTCKGPSMVDTGQHIVIVSTQSYSVSKGAQQPRL